MKFHEKACVPCQGNLPALSSEACNELLGNVPKWRILPDPPRLVRDFRFGNFAEALAFVDKISMQAEEVGHHPDICFGWGYATVTLFTHKIQGLHENDFIMAAKFDCLFAG